MDNRYSQIIEKVFFNNYIKGKTKVEFLRDEIEDVAAKLKIKLPKNLGDILYSFRFRNELPKKIKTLAPSGKEWLIKLSGRGKYIFSLEDELHLLPNESLCLHLRKLMMGKSKFYLKDITNWLSLTK